MYVSKEIHGIPKKTLVTTQLPAHRSPRNPRARPEVLSHGAIRMRLRRMCELKQSGKSHVPPEVSEDYKKGGEEREWLEIALLESIKKVGTDRKYFKQVKAGSMCLIYPQLRCLSSYLHKGPRLFVNELSTSWVDRPSSKCEWRSSKRECCRRKRKFMENGIPKKSWRSQDCIRSTLMALMIDTIWYGKWDCILYLLYMKQTWFTKYIIYHPFARSQGSQCNPSSSFALDSPKRWHGPWVGCGGCFPLFCCETHWWWIQSHSYLPNIFKWQHGGWL